jgi:hypothetical protein
MRFRDDRISREGGFSIGIDLRTGNPYLSIPVGNRLIDYDEYYRLTWDEYRSFVTDIATAMAFAEECRLRWRDDRLILPPGCDRGEPR